MAVQERDYMKGSPAGPAPALAPSGWLARANAFGEKHATAIISASTILIIFLVILFAKQRYDAARLEGAERELAATSDPEDLAKLKEKYGSTPVAPRILYKLANRYYEQGKLAAARDEYEEIRRRFPTDPLCDPVNGPVKRATETLEKNLQFEQTQKDLRAKAQALQTHPRQLPDLKDPRLEFGPVKLVKPVVEIEFSTGAVKVELFEDEAPNAVASFIQLCEEKYFDGVKVDRLNGDERIQVLAKSEKPVDSSLAVESSGLPAEAYSLVMVRKDGAAENLAGRFEILLKALPDLKDATVFGRILEGTPFVGALRKDDTIKSTKVSSKRESPYSPRYLPKK
jgi:cyclophilin family peptidyl-prolyl cis-trans isomerase